MSAIHRRVAPQTPMSACLFIERLHSGGTVPIGILLLDPAADRLYFRLRDDWVEIADEEATEVLAGLKEMLKDCTAKEGATGVFLRLEDQLSNYVRLGERRTHPIPTDWKAALDALYTSHVDPNG